MTIKQSNYVNIVKAAEVAAGRLPSNTVVGKIRLENPYTGSSEFMNLFVHFDRGMDGQNVARLTEDGELRLNPRQQYRR